MDYYVAITNLIFREVEINQKDRLFSCDVK